MQGMTEKPIQQSSNRKTRSETATVIAEIFDLSPRQVRRVMNGDSENPSVLDATIIYEEGKNALLEEVKKLVPF